MSSELVRLPFATAAEMTAVEERRRKDQAYVADFVRSLTFRKRNRIADIAPSRLGTVITFDSGDVMVVTSDGLTFADADSDFVRASREAGERAVALAHFEEP